MNDEVVLTIVQARVGSTRLPSKVLYRIGGTTLLEWVWRAAPEPRVVSIPNEEPLAYFLRTNGIGFVQWNGPPDDVLSRFRYVIKQFEDDFTHILRLTADCPMLTAQMTKEFIAQCDLRDHQTIYTNRPCDPDGFDMELFSVEMLMDADQHAMSAYMREHVTPWMYNNCRTQRVSLFGYSPTHNHKAKLSVDTHEEYLLVKKLMEITMDLRGVLER